MLPLRAIDPLMVARALSAHILKDGTILLEGSIDAGDALVESTIQALSSQRRCFSVQFTGDGPNLVYAKERRPEARGDHQPSRDDAVAPTCARHAAAGFETHAGVFELFQGFPSIIAACDMLRAARMEAAALDEACGIPGRHAGAVFFLLSVSALDLLYRDSGAINAVPAEHSGRQRTIKNHLEALTVLLDASLCTACWSAAGGEADHRRGAAGVLITCEDAQDAAEGLLRLPLDNKPSDWHRFFHASTAATMRKMTNEARSEDPSRVAAPHSVSAWIRISDIEGGRGYPQCAAEATPNIEPPMDATSAPWGGFFGFDELKADLLLRVVSPFSAASIVWFPEEAIAARKRLAGATVAAAVACGAVISHRLTPDADARDFLRGALFYGESGTGKSALARVVASAAGAALIVVSCPLLLERYFGESERSLRRSFIAARAMAPCVLVLDDIDAIGAARGGASGAAAVLSRLLTTLLNELDGVGGDGSQGAPVLVIATASTDGKTERGEQHGDRAAIAGRLGLDAALLRVGRLEVHVRVPLPSEADRLAILKASPPSSALAPGVSLSALARFTEGWSASQTAALLPEAALRASLGSPSCGLAAQREDGSSTSRDAGSITAAHLLKTASTALGRPLLCRENELCQ
jgi:hypothetical protein